MRSIFLLRAFAPLWQISFRSEAEKKNLIVIFKELNFFYEYVNLTPWRGILPKFILRFTTFAWMRSKKPTPNYYWSILTMKCPRCRRGPMFANNNSYKSLKLSHIFNMPDKCAVCEQKYDLEEGFWYGTGYVSYALAVAVSATTFVAWLVFIGVSTDDNRIFWWLGINTLILIITQPWLMRLSRVLYIRIFVRYDANYEDTKPIELN